MTIRYFKTQLKNIKIFYLIKIYDLIEIETIFNFRSPNKKWVSYWTDYQRRNKRYNQSKNSIFWDQEGRGR